MASLAPCVDAEGQVVAPHKLLGGGSDCLGGASLLVNAASLMFQLQLQLLRDSASSFSPRSSSLLLSAVVEVLVSFHDFVNIELHTQVPCVTVCDCVWP